MQSLVAHILSRSPIGEGFVRLLVLCREGGVRLILQRAPAGAGSRRPRIPLPDLFDCAEFEVEQRDDGPGFVRDVRILATHPGLAKDWNRLSLASRLTRVVADNRGSSEDAPLLFTLLAKAFLAMERGIRPDAAYLKAIFVMLRETGYPVREDWALSLPADQRADLETLLRTPLDDLQTPPDRVRVLTHRLETWATNSLDLRFPEREADTLPIP
jgi:recombinational DNA repair protein (RecF pathway)